jgi:mRNA interferase RelE/StbE
LAWKIEFDEKVYYDLEKLGKPAQKKIIKYLKERIAYLEDPRTSGKPLTGASYRGIWRYRVENYRILCKIEDAKLIVLVVGVGHRSKIYD